MFLDSATLMCGPDNVDGIAEREKRAQGVMQS